MLLNVLTDKVLLVLVLWGCLIRASAGRYLVVLDATRRCACDGDRRLNVDGDILSIEGVLVVTVLRQVVASIRIQVALLPQLYHFHLERVDLVFEQGVPSVLLFASEHSFDSNS